MRHGRSRYRASARFFARGIHGRRGTEPEPYRVLGWRDSGHVGRTPQALRYLYLDANLRVRSIAANRSTYADGAVACGSLELDPADKTRQTVLNPTVLVEVQSPSTESDDRGPKLDCYKMIASVRAVILVAQDQIHVTVHERQPDGSWAQAIHESGTLEVPAIGCQLSVSEIYEDLPDV